MSDNIPSEVYREILLLLPADSLFRLRSVCKAWRDLIDSPSFVKSHTNKSNQLSSPNSNTLLIRKETGAPLYLINLDSLDFTKSGRQLIDAIPVKQLIRPGIPRRRDLPAAPCNGLVLISGDNIEKISAIWAIWNPLTRDCHKLPPPPDADRVTSCGLGAGLWYDYDADDYRVVRIDLLFSCGARVLRTLIYSLKLGYWRRIKDCPRFPSRPEGVFVNNAFHWDTKDMITVLDVGTEDYRQLALPPNIANIQRWHPFQVRLDATGGRLTLTLSEYKINRFTGWVMKDYGGAWVKLFAIDTFQYRGGGMPTRLVTYLESKVQVLLQHDRGFIWYDVENDEVKRITIHGLSRISSSQICPGSLYRLDDRGDSALRGNVGLNKRKRKRTKKRTNTRLKFCVRDCDSWRYSDGYCSDFSCRSPSPPRSCSEGEE